MSTNNVCFIDTETTGLDPDKHSIWEVALITPDGREHVWQFPVEEMAADPFALDIGHYWERRWHSDFTSIDPLNAIYHADDPDRSRLKGHPNRGRAIQPSREWCRHFRDLTAGHHLCGAVPSFDEERLRRLLNRHGVLHRWHYHLIDIEALAVGFIAAEGWITDKAQDAVAITLPWRSDDLSRACGVEPPSEEERHTALGDARWAKRLYERIMRGEMNEYRLG